MSGGGTISTVQPAAGNLRVQSSIYGSAMPLIYGRTRVSGNLLWYGGFVAIPHTQSSGGKGGGGVSSTTYTYQAAVMMALGEGALNNVLSGWKGKKQYAASAANNVPVTSVESFTVPGGGVCTVSFSATFLNDVAVTQSFSVPNESVYTNTLVPGVDYTVNAAGQYTFASALVGQSVSITYQHSTPAYSALQNMGLSLANGYAGQPVWGYLTTNYPAQALGYSCLAYVYAPSYDLGASTSVENHSFELSTAWEAVASGDANPATIAQDLLTNGRYGANFPIFPAGDFSAWKNYALAQNLVMSPALIQQKAGAEWLKYLLDLSNTDVTWSQGVLKYVPLGDLACSANSASYTPNTTPAYDLTEDHFLVESADEDPLKIERRANDDTYNHIRVEYTNRANQYNLEVMEAKDAADVDRRGLRTKDVVEAHAICDQAVAGMLVNLLLQRELAVRNVYTFRLPWTFALLEPLDLVTVTDAYMALTRVPVRINKITELDGGDFEVEAEDCPIGMASAPAYGAQAGNGYAPNYNAVAGNVATPMFFEAPVERTLTGLEVYAAVTGAQSNWGGCNVWASMDGASYKKVGSVAGGGARYGTLTAAMLSTDTSMAVSLAGNGGQLLSASLADAQALNSLLWVDGSSGGEYLSYQTATLTGPNAYTLGGLLRTAFTSVKQAHSNGAKWARVDDAIAKSGPLDLSMIGKTIWFKFTSFNIFGGGEQALADVTAYSYAVTGGMVALPPSDVGTITSTQEEVGIRLRWPAIPDGDLDHYEIRVDGTGWADATLLTEAPSNEYLWRIQTATSRTVRIKAVDKLKNYSNNASSAAVAVTGPSAPSLAYQLSGPDEYLTWTVPASGFLVDHYEIRYGASWAAGTVVDTTKATGYRRRVDYAGARTYWVAAVDVAGNVGTAASAGVSIGVPGTVTSYRADVIDNNVLLYWGAPATGSLPVASYEVRKGATWATGTVIGSNGNSTFTMVFEQQSGTYTYWIAAVDSAGNYGTPISLSAFVNQPPDYILRANINSALAGYAISSLNQGDADAVLSVSGNTALQTSGSTIGRARGFALPANSKVYFEAYFDNYASAMQVGVSLAGGTANASLSSQTANTAFYYRPGFIGTNGTEQAVTAIPAGYQAGVIGVAVDQVGNTVTFFLNGVQLGTAIALPAGTWYPALSMGAVVSQQFTLNFGAAAFRYQPSAGFSGLQSNVLRDGTTLLLPVNTTETWSSHFTSHSWTSIQDAINAGNTYYLEPSQTGATYTEDIDYGSTLPATSIVVTLNSTLLHGAVSASCQIQYKLNWGDAWTNAPAGATSIIAVNFRYVRITYTFTAAAGANLLRVNGLNIKLSMKQRSDGGSATSAIGGVSISFGYAFISADTPVVQANGLDSFSKPYQVAVIYSGGLNPTGFSVRIFDSAGTEKSGVLFSWSVKGY